MKMVLCVQYLQVDTKSLCMQVRSYLCIPFHSQHKNTPPVFVLDIFQVNSQMLNITEAGSLLFYIFNIFMIVKICLQFHAQGLCLTMATCVHVLTPNTLTPKSENLDKFHYLCVSISSFVILKMESARLSLLTISGTNP